MEYLGETLIVLLILVAVAVAAVMFEPADPLDNWRRLAERYGTNDRPANAQYPMQQVLFGGPRSGLKPLAPGANFDIAVDDYGLWIAARGIDAGGSSPTLKIPGTHVKPAGKRKSGFVFKLFAEPPVRILVAGEAGSELMRRSQVGQGIIDEQ
jgi:hypothetical protein